MDLPTLMTERLQALNARYRVERVTTDPSGRVEIDGVAQDGLVHFDAPMADVSRRALLHCHGWLLVSGPHPVFEVNGDVIEHVTHWPRPDVEDTVPGAICVGFEFWIDAERHFKRHGRGLHIVARVGATILAQRFIRVLPCAQVDPRDNPITYFIHMAKTAGTSVRQRFEALSEPRLLGVYEEQGNFPPIRLPTLSAAALADFDFVFGHFSYGAHAPATQRPYSYMTLLRDPYEYLISLYFFFKNVIRNNFVGLRSIHEMIEQRSAYLAHIDNNFCRVLSGAGADEVITEAHLNRAIENIDRDFAFVGLTEWLPESMQRMSAITGVDLMTGLGRVNATPESAEQSLLDRAALREAAHDLVQYDLELYDHVRSRFFTSTRRRSGGGPPALASEMTA